MPVSVPEVLARMRLFDGAGADELAVVEKLVFVNRAAARRHRLPRGRPQ